MDFKIIGTGSSGNCFLINDDLMIDMGLSYSKISKSLSGIKGILLTHIHGDHFNRTAIRKTAVAYPNIKFICGEWLYDHLFNVIFDKSRIITVKFDKLYKLGSYQIAIIKAYHDVENCGYRIMQDDHKHFHITDTATLEGITALDYDTASIECNHDEIRALELIEQARENGEFSHLPGAMNSHLSVQQTVDFIHANRIKHLIPCHMGLSTKREVLRYLTENLISELEAA